MMSLRQNADSEQQLTLINSCLALFCADMHIDDSLTSSHIETRRALALSLVSALRLPIELQSFADFISVFLRMTVDIDVGVRVIVARGVTLFFSIFPSGSLPSTSFLSPFNVVFVRV